MKAIAVLGFPLDAWPADRDVRRAMRGELVRPEWMSGPVAGDAAGTSPEEECAGVSTTAPSSGRLVDLDSITSAAHLASLIDHHKLIMDSPSTYRCSGCNNRSHNERGHFRHVSHLITDMLTTDHRINLAINK